MRYRSDQRGKRGGMRVIYYFLNNARTFFLLSAYPKSESTDLSPFELKILTAVIEQMKK